MLRRPRPGRSRLEDRDRSLPTRIGAVDRARPCGSARGRSVRHHRTPDQGGRADRRVAPASPRRTDCVGAALAVPRHSAGDRGLGADPARLRSEGRRDLPDRLHGRRVRRKPQDRRATTLAAVAPDGDGRDPADDLGGARLCDSDRHHRVRRQRQHGSLGRGAGEGGDPRTRSALPNGREAFRPVPDRAQLRRLVRLVDDRPLPGDVRRQLGKRAGTG
jgi:hypothetical protein